MSSLVIGVGYPAFFVSYAVFVAAVAAVLCVVTTRLLWKRVRP